MADNEDFRYQLRDLTIRVSNLESKIAELTFYVNQIRQEQSTIVPLVEKLDRESDLQARLEKVLRYRIKERWTTRERIMAVVLGFVAVGDFGLRLFNK